MPPNTLPPTVLKRLMRHQARLEGAQQAMQAAESVCRSLASNYEDALRGACEDAEIGLPLPGVPAQIHIDWNTGEVTWRVDEQPSPNGLVMPEIGAG
jgi:hypothetical protein